MFHDLPFPSPSASVQVLRPCVARVGMSPRRAAATTGASLPAGWAAGYAGMDWDLAANAESNMLRAAW
jgi:hypothetical protein